MSKELKLTGSRFMLDLPSGFKALPDGSLPLPNRNALSGVWTSKDIPLIENSVDFLSLIENHELLFLEIKSLSDQFDNYFVIGYLKKVNGSKLEMEILFKKETVISNPGTFFSLSNIYSALRGESEKTWIEIFKNQIFDCIEIQNISILIKINQKFFEKYYEIKTLKKGTLLYHGTSSNWHLSKKNPEFVNPAWFSFSESDTLVAPYILVFKLTKDTKFIDYRFNNFEYKSNFENDPKKPDGEGRRRLMGIFISSVYPLNFPSEFKKTYSLPNFGKLSIHYDWDVLMLKDALLNSDLNGYIGIDQHITLRQHREYTKQGIDTDEIEVAESTKEICVLNPKESIKYVDTIMTELKEMSLDQQLIQFKIGKSITTDYNLSEKEIYLKQLPNSERNFFAFFKGNSKEPLCRHVFPKKYILKYLLNGKEENMLLCPNGCMF